MRDITLYIFIINLIFILLASIPLFLKINRYSKLNLSDDTFRCTQECKDLLDKEAIGIEKILQKMKSIYFVVAFMIIDTTFIYEPALLQAYSNNKILVCSKNHIKFEVNKNTHQYSRKNTIFKSGQLSDKDNNTVDLDMCKIKNKRWWE